VGDWRKEPTDHNLPQELEAASLSQGFRVRTS